MSEFLKITYRHMPVGRVECWMEGTGRFEGGREIMAAVREPTPEDLLYAERTESGKIRYVRALLQIFLPPFALQAAVNSDLYDEEVPWSALHALLKLTYVVNQLAAEKLKEVVGDGPLAVLYGVNDFGFNPDLPSPVTWTSVTSAQPQAQPQSTKP